jgi:bifunctional ADP-heptose synthase (sugar kinase/adenylyltransferase)
MKKVAILGDSFVDRYCFGNVERISPEAPVPILDVTKKEVRSGGALNVALNLYGLGI